MVALMPRTAAEIAKRLGISRVKAAMYLKNNCKPWGTVPGSRGYVWAYDELAEDRLAEWYKEYSRRKHV